MLSACAHTSSHHVKACSGRPDAADGPADCRSRRSTRLSGLRLGWLRLGLRFGVHSNAHIRFDLAASSFSATLYAAAKHALDSHVDANELIERAPTATRSLALGGGSESVIAPRLGRDGATAARKNLRVVGCW